MADAYLQLNHLSKQFGKFTALNNIDLDILPNELICFLGPSGCGKTTLLRIIAGLELQSSGSILLKGTDISFAPPASRNYGIVFQSYALFPNLTVAENIAYGLVNQKKHKAEIKHRVAELLQLVGLPNSAQKFPTQMSGGQQQRVALARALANAPDLLLLDEPLSALDATVRLHLRTEIYNLQKKLGITTIMVTHDQEEALAIADRIVVMRQGKIEQIGTPLQIYRHPQTAFVANFIGKMNHFRARSNGNGEFSCHQTIIHSNQHLDMAKDLEVEIFIRPEDITINLDQVTQSEILTGIIQHIEFLGNYCVANVLTNKISDTPINIQISLNQMRNLNLITGEELKFAFIPECITVFAIAG